MVLRRLCLVLGLTALTACGDDFEPKSFLSGYRVLAIQAEPPELVLTLGGAPTAEAQPSKAILRAVDFDPTSVGLDFPGAEPPQYRWSYCTLSTGSSGEYACLDPLKDHPLEGNSRETVFDLNARLPEILGDLQQLAALSGIAPEDVSPASLTLTSLPIQIRLKSGGESIGIVTTVKNLNILLPPNDESADAPPPMPNRNPIIRGFRIAGLDACTAETRHAGCFEAAPVDSPALLLEVELEPGAAEACSEAELEAFRCDQDTGRESLFFSWYTTSGSLEFGTTNAETLENQLELPKSFPADRAGPTLPVRVFVAVRDGRGGIDVREGAFLLTQQSPESSATPP